MADPTTRAGERFTVEQLRQMIIDGPDSVTPAVLEQAAEDAEVLERLEAWFDARYTYPGKTELRGSIARIRHEIRVEASAQHMTAKHGASLRKLADAERKDRPRG